jgi:ribonuclease P protein component
LKQFSLSRSERVRKKKEIETVFNSGKILFSYDLFLKSIFIIEKNINKSGVEIAAAVSKKVGKAVWRNRVKRLIKESYRLNKHLIMELAKEKKSRVVIIFSPNKLNEKKAPKVKLNNISPGIVELIKEISQQI